MMRSKRSPATPPTPATPEEVYALAARRDGSAAAAVRELAERAAEHGDGAVRELLGALDPRRLGLEASVSLLGATARSRRDPAGGYAAFRDATLAVARRKLPAAVADELVAFLAPAGGPQ